MSVKTRLFLFQALSFYSRFELHLLKGFKVRFFFSKFEVHVDTAYLLIKNKLTMALAFENKFL